MLTKIESNPAGSTTSSIYASDIGLGYTYTYPRSMWYIVIE